MQDGQSGQGRVRVPEGGPEGYQMRAERVRLFSPSWLGPGSGGHTSRGPGDKALGIRLTRTTKARGHQHALPGTVPQPLEVPRQQQPPVLAVPTGRVEAQQMRL